MVESELDLAKELQVAAAVPERSPVRPTLLVAEIENKFGVDAVGFIGKQIKEGGLNIDGVPQEEAIKRQMGVLIAADQAEKEGFVNTDAGYEVDGGKYTYAFLPIKDIADYEEGKTPLIKNTYELCHAFETLEVIITQGNKPEEEQSLDPDSAQEFLDVLTAHTEVIVVFGKDEQKTEKKLTYKQWKNGQFEDGTAIPEGAEVSFQLVGRAEAGEPLEEPERARVKAGKVNIDTLKGEMEDFNDTIAVKIQELANITPSNEQEQKQISRQLTGLLTTHLINPLEGEGVKTTTFVEFGRVCKDIAAGLVSGDAEKIQAAVAEIPRQKKLLEQAALEVKKATAGDNFNEDKFNTAYGQIKSLDAGTAVKALSDPEQWAALEKDPDFKKAAKYFDESWRKEFCRRLFGKTEISKNDLSDELKAIVPKDAWDRLQSGLMNSMWIFMVFSAFKEVVTSITPGEGETSK